jgi:hypothetical protein
MANYTMSDPPPPPEPLNHNSVRSTPEYLTLKVWPLMDFHPVVYLPALVDYHKSQTQSVSF